MVKTLTELKALCPQSFDELTCEVFENIHSKWELDREEWERDYFKLFSILTDTPYKLVNPTPEKEAVIYELTKWVTDSPINYSRLLPEEIVIDQKTIKIPKDVAALSIGQNILLKQRIAKSHYIEESLSFATAIYLQPLFDEKKFDYDRAKELRNVVKKMPAKDIYPIGFFLLSHVKKNGWKPVSYWSRTLTSLKAKCIRMLPTWLKSICLTAGRICRSLYGSLNTSDLTPTRYSGRRICSHLSAFWRFLRTEMNIKKDILIFTGR